MLQQLASEVCVDTSAAVYEDVDGGGVTALCVVPLTTPEYAERFPAASMARMR
jgi:hypothetical protein